MVEYGFDKTMRLLKRRDFLRLSQENRKVNNQQFIALIGKSEKEKTRIGVTVTKRVGDAVTRNRLKRYIREYVRLHPESIDSVMDVNIIVKKEASNLPFGEVTVSLKHLFEKIRKQK